MYQHVMAALHPILSQSRGVEFFKNLSAGRNIGIVPCLEDQTISSVLRRITDLTQAHFAFFLHEDILRGLQIDIHHEDLESEQKDPQRLHSEVSLGMVYFGALNTGERRFRVNGERPGAVGRLLHLHPISEDALARLA